LEDVKNLPRALFDRADVDTYRHVVVQRQPAVAMGMDAVLGG
jgi:hypothetical protein